MSPLVIGFNSDSKESSKVKDPLEDCYGVYSLEEIPEDIRPVISEEAGQDISLGKNVADLEESPVTFDGLMDSPWPMYCHDTRHTGQSPYITTDNSGFEKWKYKTWGTAWGGVGIDKEGVIYIAAYPFHAVYPNGTLKWTFKTEGYLSSVTPAIDENGTIYIGDRYGYFYAINPDGTKKWKCSFGDDIWSSPAIGEDGTIYIGDTNNQYIKALNTNNGTVKWKYKTDHVVYSSPAIGNDGTVYCGSHDTYLYALYPNNGTLKWRYKTGGWIRTSPCIDDDGTIYVVSLDNYLHAVKSDGSLKWKTNVGAGTSPTIGQDGTIYCGYNKLFAINPTNGSVKWTFNVQGKIRGATPCNSYDGTIYFGNYDGSDIVAVNSDGTEKWRVSIGGDVESAPAISEDGTIYIGDGLLDGYLHAFGRGPLEADANGPYYGLINQPVQFKGLARGGYSPYSYYWIFGDGEISDIQNPMHIYTDDGNYTITLTVTDNVSNSSIDTLWVQVQATNDPPEKPIINGVKKGQPHQDYDYTFVSTEPEGNPIWYFIDWDDNTTSGWLGPYDSGYKITLTHTWHEEKVFVIKAKAKDIFDAESEWAEFKVNLPRDKTMAGSLILKLFERFPLLEVILSKIINL